MMRVEDVVLLPARVYPAPVTLFSRETIEAVLLRIRDRAEDEFPVVDHGVLRGVVRRCDLLALAASDRITREID